MLSTLFSEYFVGSRYVRGLCEAFPMFELNFPKNTVGYLRISCAQISV